MQTEKSELKDRHYKFIHIFMHNSEGFNLKLIEMICDWKNGFVVDEHLFVTSYLPLYNRVKDKCHIEYIETPRYHQRDMINIIGGGYDGWLIVHSFPGEAALEIIHVKKEYLHRVLWRTWGHDVYRKRWARFHSNKKIKHLLLKGYEIIYNIKLFILYAVGISNLKKICAVGTGNVIDEINVKEQYGIVKFYEMPYPSRGEYEVMVNLLTNYNEVYCHVMVGHSGFAGDRHCDLVALLKKYEKEKIVLHVMLSYGDEQYVQRVKQCVTMVWNGKVEFLEATLPFKEYAEYVNKMDIVILDSIMSCALGNLGMALFLKKKLFLNRDGILQKGLLAENISFHYTDEIANMSFEEFSAKEAYTVPHESTLVFQPYENYVAQWKKMFNELGPV